MKRLLSFIILVAPWMNGVAFSSLLGCWGMPKKYVIVDPRRLEAVRICDTDDTTVYAHISMSIDAIIPMTTGHENDTVTMSLHNLRIHTRPPVFPSFATCRLVYSILRHGISLVVRREGYGTVHVTWTAGHREGSCVLHKIDPESILRPSLQQKHTSDT